MVLKGAEPPGLSEMSALWQEINSGYCTELEKQTTDEMLLNLSDSLAEWMTIQDGTPFSDENTVIVRLLLRTRRFNQAVGAVLTQDEAGKKQMAYKIASTITKLGEMLAYLKTKSNSLPAIHSDEMQKQAKDLLFGNSNFQQLTPERYGISGVSIGLAANACLLGLCGESEHVKILMTLARPEDPYIGYGTRFAAVDAIDRIMMRQLSNTSLAPETQNVVTEYAAWRKIRGLPPRNVASTFTYNAPGTPHDMAGTIAGLPKQSSGEFELPYVPACYSNDCMCLEPGVLDDQEKFRQHNEDLLKMNCSDAVLREDAAVGLTIEDIRFITMQAQRLTATIEE